MIRHNSDITLFGSLTYLFACLLNTMAIFMTHIFYTLMALPFFVQSLITMIVQISAVDEFDNIPMPGETTCVILFFMCVVFPIKLIPCVFANMLENITDKMILHTTYHIRNRNRSGYEVRSLIKVCLIPTFIA